MIAQRESHLVYDFVFNQIKKTKHSVQETSLYVRQLLNMRSNRAQIDFSAATQKRQAQGICLE